MAVSNIKRTEPVDPQALRALLAPYAARGERLTYQQVAQLLGLEPPLTINRVVRALETLMSEDVAAGRPLLSAIVVSRTAPMPPPGFFAHARALGVWDGPESGPEAAKFHQEQIKALQQPFPTVYIK